MDATRLESGEAVLDRARSLRETARLTREHARSARTCSGGLVSAGTAGRVPVPRVRVGIAGHGAGYVLVEVAGAVDIACRRELAGVLSEAAAVGRPAVIVDLTAVTLLAAAGFGSLQGAADLLAERDGQLHVVCPSGSPVGRVLRILDTHGWRLHPDVRAAVAAVTGPA